jgi:hypothetical protein
MLDELGSYVKLAVDVERAVLAGGGALHADCEAALLARRQPPGRHLGADWIPATQQVHYEALINIRPRRNNLAMTIQDSAGRDSGS